MSWNWQKKEWLKFKYDENILKKYESTFLYNSGIFLGTLKHIIGEEKKLVSVEIICEEAFKTSAIEGEILNRDSLHSSILRNFGLKADNRKIPPAEQGIAKMMLDLYQNFTKPLSHKALCNWNSMITNDGNYRSSKEPMQVVSGSIYNPRIHFEAPPSDRLHKEMNIFIEWFNTSNPKGKAPLPPLMRAGVAHLYFVCIHPFEDGNGRIARALAEKSLSQCIGQPSLISLSKIIEKQKKNYYSALDASNKDLEITGWLEYFSKTILEAQNYSQNMIEFLVKKARFYEKNKTLLNSRQEKVIARIFQEGHEGFKGGLSAENYLSITSTSRATATRDLQDLVDKKILNKKGQLKSTRYYLDL
ncbi:MAG: cell filamentation protein Fic [Candidatus Melainabacteria bacterium RIFCSPLOWO2_12_FULL_35_11]|nr:MAG: cell filamentation protein Fic [Candidatus Melainabacteria bacterium RIFCSPLOWO2_12_FULL_35_11]